MKTFKYCPLITVGDVFTRIDRNGKVWTAEVINRTEYFVDVKKNQPYQRKVGDEYGNWHYEDAPDTFERCMLHRFQTEIEDGTETYIDLYGNKVTKTKKKKIYTDEYWIDVKENFSRSWKYDKGYTLVKSDPNIKHPTVEEALEEFHKFCEEE